jgi:hypothetical protein
LPSSSWSSSAEASWHEEQLARYPSVDSEPCHNTRILRELAFNEYSAVLERFHPYRTHIMSRFNPMRGNMAHAAYQLKLRELPKKFKKVHLPYYPLIRKRRYVFLSKSKNVYILLQVDASSIPIYSPCVTIITP